MKPAPVAIPTAESAADRIRRLVSPAIRALSAYAVPEHPRAIKLDAMENPHALPAVLRAQWLARLEEAALNRYPDSRATRLIERFRTAFGVDARFAVLPGNGSDELIQLLILALGAPGSAVMAPTPGFVMYEQIARATGRHFVGVPLARDFALDKDAMLEALREHDPALLFLARPNNPTGNLFSESAVEEICGAARGLVVLDEAYHAFSRADGLELAARHENVVILRTLSKMGLAGLRLGFLIGAPAWLAEFDKLRLPYNLNTLSQASAEFFLEHKEIFDRQARQIVGERERLAQVLAGLPGVTVWSSAANFLLFRTGLLDGTRVFMELLHRGILIKNLHKPGTPLENCLRVTVGTEEENDAFLRALREILP
jgi:histidinol-phosphate aminotransferase